MFRFLRRALARPEAVAAEPPHSETTATVLRLPIRPKDSPGDIVMMNSPRAPAPWATLPGAGWSYAKAWPIEAVPVWGTTLAVVIPPGQMPAILVARLRANGASPAL